MSTKSCICIMKCLQVQMLILLLIITSGLACNPWVEEGREWTMDCPPGNLWTTVVFLVKFKDGREIQGPRCNQSGCTNDSTIYIPTMASNTSAYWSYFKISQVNKSFESAACLVDSNSVRLCQLWVYVKPDKPVCSTPTLNSNNSTLTMVCTTARVYPEVGCYISHYKTSNVLSGQVYPRTSASADGRGDLSANCTAILNLNGTDPSDEQLRMTMYPTSGEPPDDESLKVSSDWSDVLHFQLPVVADLDNCPNGTDVAAATGGIKVGSSATCKCVLKDLGYPAGQAQWFRSNIPVGIANSNDRSSTLTIKYDPKDPNPSYECGATSTLKGVTGRKTYSPVFVNAPVNVSILISDDGMFDFCPLKQTKVYVTCTTPYDKETPIFSVIVDGVMINQSKPDTMGTSGYFAKFSWRPDSGGRHIVTCRASNPTFSDLYNEASKTLTVRAPPLLPPQITVSNNQPTTVNKTVHVTEGERITVSCQIDGGSPTVTLARLYCMSEIEPTGGNPVRWIMTVTKTMNGLSCRCEADHVTGCYNLKTEVTFALDSLVAGEDKLTLDLGLAIGLSCAGFLIIVVTIVAVNLMRKHRRYEANAKSKDNDSKPYNELSDPTTEYTYADSSVYEDLNDYVEPRCDGPIGGKSLEGWPSSGQWSANGSSNYPSSMQWPSGSQGSTDWTSNGQVSSSINWSDYDQPRPPLCRIDRSNAANDYIHVI